MVAFSPEIAEKVCEYLAEGNSLCSLRRNKPDGFPSVSGVMKWLAQGDAYIAAGNKQHPKALFVEQYARTLPIRADVLFEQCLDIADDSDGDTFLGEEGETVYKLDHIQRMKLRVDTRKWMVGKMNPKKYGDRQVVDGKIEHSGTINDDRMANAMDILARLGSAVDKQNK